MPCSTPQSTKSEHQHNSVTPIAKNVTSEQKSKAKMTSAVNGKGVQQRLAGNTDHATKSQSTTASKLMHSHAVYMGTPPISSRRNGSLSAVTAGSRSNLAGTPLNAQKNATRNSIHLQSSGKNEKSQLMSTTPRNLSRSRLSAQSSKRLVTPSPRSSVGSRIISTGSSSRLIQPGNSSTPLSVSDTPSKRWGRWSESGVQSSSPTTVVQPLEWQDETQSDDASSSAVTVAVRVRPLSSRERECADSSAVKVCGKEVTLFSEANGTCHTFAYDHCFGASDSSSSSGNSQATVYQQLARPLLDRAYQGYNVCLFAYGQTGSGKTYSIMGEEGVEGGSEEGIIPRFCQELFSRADELQADTSHQQQQQLQQQQQQGSPGVVGAPRVQLKVELSYIEIYNEKLYDLVGNGGDEGTREPLRVREHPVLGPHVVGAAVHPVTSYQQLRTWLMLGNSERSIAATSMNDKSSRSHSVFSLKLTYTQIESIGGEELHHSRVSNINIVDLAGSERLAAATDEYRIKEGVCINKSLLTLGKVITALAESSGGPGKRRNFVPYRESVLTWLLKESLGGNSETAMLATVSPLASQSEESLATLRYAGQARSILNSNRVNEDPAARVIRNLKAEVERLRAQHSPAMGPSLRLFNNSNSFNDLPLHPPPAATPLSEQETSTEADLLRQKEEEILALREELKSSRGELQATEAEWQTRLLQSTSAAAAALERCKRAGIVVRTGDTGSTAGPCLVSLCDDPQLSQQVVYALKEGRTTLGRKGADLLLRGLLTDGVHCSLLLCDGSLSVESCPGADTYVNGQLVEEGCQRRLQHGDRLVLDAAHYFLVSLAEPLPTSASSTHDYATARQELLQQQEIRCRDQMLQQQQRDKEQLLQQLQQQREQVMLLQQHLESEQSTTRASERKQQQLAQEKQTLEQQLVFWQQEQELLLKEQEQLLEEQVFSPEQHSLPPLDHNFLSEVEALLNESVMAVEQQSEVRGPKGGQEAMELSLAVTRANKLAKVAGAPYELVRQERVSVGGIESVVVITHRQRHYTAVLQSLQFYTLLHTLQDCVLGLCDLAEVDALISWQRPQGGSSGSPVVPGFVLLRRNTQALNGSMNASFNTSLLDASMGPATSTLKRSRPNAGRACEGSGSTGLQAVAASCSAALLLQGEQQQEEGQQPLLVALLLAAARLCHAVLTIVRRAERAVGDTRQVQQCLVTCTSCLAAVRLGLPAALVVVAGTQSACLSSAVSPRRQQMLRVRDSLKDAVAGIHSGLASLCESMSASSTGQPGDIEQLSAHSRALVRHLSSLLQVQELGLGAEHLQAVVTRLATADSGCAGAGDEGCQSCCTVMGEVAVGGLQGLHLGLTAQRAASSSSVRANRQSHLVQDAVVSLLSSATELVQQVLEQPQVGEAKGLVSWLQAVPGTLQDVAVALQLHQTTPDHSPALHYPGLQAAVGALHTRLTVGLDSVGVIRPKQRQLVEAVAAAATDINRRCSIASQTSSCPRSGIKNTEVVSLNTGESNDDEQLKMLKEMDYYGSVYNKQFGFDSPNQYKTSAPGKENRSTGEKVTDRPSKSPKKLQTESRNVTPVKQNEKLSQVKRMANELDTGKNKFITYKTSSNSDSKTNANISQKNSCSPSSRKTVPSTRTGHSTTSSASSRVRVTVSPRKPCNSLTLSQIRVVASCYSPPRCLSPAASVTATPAHEANAKNNLPVKSALKTQPTALPKTVSFAVSREQDA